MVFMLEVLGQLDLPQLAALVPAGTVLGLRLGWEQERLDKLYLDCTSGLRCR